MIDGIPTPRLEADIVSLAEAISRRMQAWLALVAEHDQRRAGLASGFRGTAEWLAWSCALGPRAARDHVRVARRLVQWPLVRSAFAEGRLSYSQVRALTRASADEDEAALLALAGSSTAAQLESAVRSLRSAPSADVEVANRAHEARFVDWWWDLDGALRVHGRFGADDGAALVEAIETGAEALHGGGVARPPRGARLADALAEMALSGAPRAQVTLHVDEAALACTAAGDEPREGELCSLRDGPAVPSETARRLACDSEVVNGHGRRRRVVGPALRAALELRDSHCRFLGCDRRHGVHAHHIEHWAHGGATDADNLVLLCRFHHRLVHEEGFTVRRAEGSVSFARPDGRRLDSAAT